MKQYPSIPQSTGQKFEGLGLVDVFDKLDGNNLRFEFSKKQGWHKFGSRTQMVDLTSEQFGPAVRRFLEEYAEWIPTCFKKTPQKIVIFGEWSGPNSFCGMHAQDDLMDLTFFDACVDNRGWLDPRDFRKAFEGSVPVCRYLGSHNWTRGFIDRVRSGAIDGITFEGVVGKTIQGSQLKMGKAKTQEWYDKVYALYPEKDADKLVAS